MPIALGKKYRKYVNLDVGSFHIALLSADVTVRGSYRSKTKTLRAAFDTEFRRHLAAIVDPGERHFRH